MLGSYAVGKTSLVRRFVEGRFDDRYLSTIGVKVSRRSVQLPTTEMTLLLWDLESGLDFSAGYSSYLRGTAGVLLVCDLTRPETLRLLTDYRGHVVGVNGDIPLVLVLNKADLVTPRDIAELTNDEVARAFQCPIVVTSAKEGLGVESAFSLLAEQLI